MTSDAWSQAALTTACAPAHFAEAQYLVDAAGAVTLTSAGAQLAEARRAMDRLAGALDRSYVGATWASLFVRHRWLRQFSVRLWAEHEHDDEGGSYLSYYNSVSHVVLEPGHCVPEVLCTEGQGDNDLIEDHLWGEISEFDGDAFLCLGLSAAGADVSYIISRIQLDELAAQGAVRGEDAFSALFAGGVAEESGNAG